MNKVLRCIILSSLFVMSMVASVVAAPYDPPVAIATPPIDRALLAAYGEAAHGADIRFTIKEDGSVGDVEVVSSSGSSALDAAIVDTISKWRFSPATDSNGKPVASSKTEYIDFKN